jgi:hypothetical protein
MPQLFPRSANNLARISIIAGLLSAGLGLALLYILQSSPYVTEVTLVKRQPVPFSHDHHVQGLGIDCRYCHWSVESSSNANIPPPGLCMNCHKKMWADQPMLKPIRDAYKNDTPIKWTKIHKLPEFVYFNHSAHVNKGVGCASCHGKVNEMPLMYKENTLYMGWCLKCHRNPEPNLRPVAEITNMDWQPTEEWKKTDKLQTNGVRRVPEGHINQLTNCWTCHR